MPSYNTITHWYNQGLLYKIVGVQPGTGGAKLKEACRVARLSSHPDKGGDGKVFNIVELAIQLLLNVLPDIPHDRTPPRHLVLLRKEVEQCRESFDMSAGTGGDVTRLERTRERYITAHQHYLEQLRIVREQQQERHARVDRMRYDAMREKLRKAYASKKSTRFPNLPKPMEHDRLDELRQKYRNLGKRKYEHQKSELNIEGILNERQAILIEAQYIVKFEIEKM